MTEAKLNRPPQVTLAGCLAVAGSTLLVFSLFDSLTALRSVEMRETVSRFLASPPGNGLGLSTDRVLSVLHVLLLVAGAAAAAAAVLGVYVLRRHPGARIALTLAAAAVVLTAPVTGGVLPMVVGASAVLLWTGSARSWFAGTAPAAAAVGGGSDQVKPPVTSGSATSPPAGDGQTRLGASAHEPDRSDAPPPTPYPGDSPDRPVPPPYHGAWPQQPEAQSPTAQPQQPAQQPASQPYDRPHAQPYAQPYAQPPAYAYPAPAGIGGAEAQRRPGTVTTACILTWVFSGLTLAMAGLIMLTLAVSSQAFLDAVEQQGLGNALDISNTDLLRILWLVSVVLALLSLVSIVLAVFTFRRNNVARYALAATAAGSALFGLGGFPVSLLNVAAAGATAVLLLTGRANDWFRRRDVGSSSTPLGGPPAPSWPGDHTPGPPPGPPSQSWPGDQNQPKGPSKNVW